MAQGQVQIQKAEQTLRQTQIVSQQQMLQAAVTELPVQQLVERIKAEMDDNPALESYPEDTDYPVQEDVKSTDEDEDFASINEREERQSALDDALNNMVMDDGELPVYAPTYQSNGSEQEDRVYGTSVTFIDILREQMGETIMTDRQRHIMEYLIGSLDDDGFLRKSSDNIADELAIYHNMDTSAEEVEETVKILHSFDPAGIGARNLRECMLIQIGRREQSVLTKWMLKAIRDGYDFFIRKQWAQLAKLLDIDEEGTKVVADELCRLNPKPGMSVGEAEGKSIDTITPDFIVDTADDGTITFYLNGGDIPDLYVSESFLEMMRNYKEGCQLSKQMKDALLYTKRKVEAAQGFIDAIKTRKRTLTITMRAIIQWQKKFFEDGDETCLRPMRLRDIAEKTGLDMSTVSRVNNSKYVQTKWGIFPLKYFFSEGISTAEGEELATRQIKVALKEIIETEDKIRPKSDIQLMKELNNMGYPIARRTVSKYREQLGIPVARLRK